MAVLLVILIVAVKLALSAGPELPCTVWLALIVKVCGTPTGLVLPASMETLAEQVGNECIATSLSVEVKLCEERVSAMNVLKQALPANDVRSMPPSKKVACGKVALVPAPLNW